MRCPICGSENCQIITSMHTEGKDFSASKGCCGWLLAGPVGVLCGFAQRESKHIQSLTGCAIHAGRNGKYKQNGSDLDVIHEDVQKILRVPSDAGAQLFHRRLSASAVCQMHRDSGRACNRNGGIPFPGCLFTESDWNYSAYDRRNRAAVHILRIDKRSAVIHRNTVWVWDDERLHSCGPTNR